MRQVRGRDFLDVTHSSPVFGPIGAASPMSMGDECSDAERPPLPMSKSRQGSRAVSGGLGGIHSRCDAVSQSVFVVPSRWATQDPAFARLTTFDDVLRIARSGDVDRVDALFRALLRFGSVRGGSGDPDAVLMLIELLTPGLTALAVQMADLTPDPYAVAISELAVQILEFGPGPRGGLPRRAFASHLLRETRRRMLAQLRPRTPAPAGLPDVPVDSLFALMTAVFDTPAPGCGPDAEAECDDLFEWAERSGVLSRRDAQLLIAAEESRDRRRNATPQRRVAANCGVHPSTLRRHRARALKALCASRDRYLAEAAAA